jgi:hypothetical protein
MSRSRTLGKLKIVASVVVVIAFVTLFVGGAVGLIGSPDDARDKTVGVDEPSAGQAVPSDGGTAEPDDTTAATAGTETTGEPTDEPAAVVTDVPPQQVKDSKRLKRTLEWLRRGLADETTFRVGTFNVLGSSHTAKGGNRKGWASGYTRMGWAYSLISQAELDVIGFQELEDVQYNRFLSLGGGNWAAYPGNTLDRGSIRNSLAWRTDVWELVTADSIGIPYFGGQIIRRPVVKLKNIESGREVWFFNTHNPASTPKWGNNARWRAAAIGLEVGLANELGADGTPVVFTGDFNDRAEAYCPLTAATELEAANGGSNDGSCVVPSSPDVDWIFGSGMEFSGFVSASQGIEGRVSDHPFVYAQAYVEEEPLEAQPSSDASPSNGATEGDAEN